METEEISVRVNFAFIKINHLYPLIWYYYIVVLLHKKCSAQMKEQY